MSRYDEHPAHLQVFAGPSRAGSAQTQRYKGVRRLQVGMLPMFLQGDFSCVPQVRISTNVSAGANSTGSAGYL